MTLGITENQFIYMSPKFSVGAIAFGSDKLYSISGGKYSAFIYNDRITIYSSSSSSLSIEIFGKYNLNFFLDIFNNQIQPSSEKKFESKCNSFFDLKSFI